MPVGVEHAEVAGAEAAVVVERVGVERRVERSPSMSCGPLARISPSSPDAGDLPSSVTSAASTPGDRPTLGVGELLVGVAWRFIVRIGASVMP